MDVDKVKQLLQDMLYAEHLGDAHKALFKLGPELGLGEPIYHEYAQLYGDHPYIWPWEKEACDTFLYVDNAFGD